MRELRSVTSRAQNQIDFTVVLGYSFCIAALDDGCPLWLCSKGCWLTPFAMIFAAWLRSKTEPKTCMSSSCGVARPDLLDEFSVSPDPHRWIRRSSKVTLDVSNIGIRHLDVLGE